MIKLSKFCKKLNNNKRIHHSLVLFGALVAVALLTLLIFLYRASSPIERNLPVTWELSNSDNGVLFQFVQDIFSGRKLSWSFSPQVYIFPEIPLSIISYALSGGNIYRYYIFVAIINNCLLFLAYLGLASYIHKERDIKKTTAVALLAVTPLLLLPLLTNIELYAYHWAPTYYYGAYLMALVLPIIYLTENRIVRALLSLSYILAAASNPLLLIFSMPPLFFVFLINFIKGGFTKILKQQLLVTIILLIGSATLRTFMFGRYAGTSPLNYISIELFARRLNDLLGFLSVYNDGILNIAFGILSIASLLGCLVYLIVLLRNFLGKGLSEKPYFLIGLYLSSLPIISLLALYALMNLNRLYLWPIFVLPVSFPALFIRNQMILKNCLIISFVLMFVFFVFRGYRIGGVSNYLLYRSPETKCLDKNLPSNAVGYSTFSDARKLSLVSEKQFMLIPVLELANPTGWLSNKAYARNYFGSFFIINEKGGENPIRKDVLLSLFGSSDKVVTCENLEIWMYSNDSKLDKIKHYYEKSL